MNEEINDKKTWVMVMGEDIMMKLLYRKENDMENNNIDKESLTATMGTIVTFSLKGYIIPYNSFTISNDDDNDTDTDNINNSSNIKNELNDKNNIKNKVYKSKIEMINDEDIIMEGIKPFEIWNNQTIQIGEGDVIPAIELSLRQAHVGDIYRLRCTDKFAYNDLGRPELQSSSFITSFDSSSTICKIPPYSRLEFEIEVIKHNMFEDNMDQWQSNLDNVSLRKECGNRWFSYLDYNKACRAYSKGASLSETSLQNEDYIHNQVDENGNLKKENPMIVLYLSCLNNLAACYLSIGNYSKTKEICTKILELDNSNTKALLRASKATLSLHEYDECEICLKTIFEIEPNNELAIKEKKKLKKALIEYKNSSKKMALKMSTKLFQSDKNKGDNNNDTNENIKEEIVEEINEEIETEINNNNNNKEKENEKENKNEKENENEKESLKKLSNFTSIVFLFVSVITILVAIITSMFANSS
jgi:tetratricopeptide (TPR) repeat protein